MLFWLAEIALVIVSGAVAGLLLLMLIAACAEDAWYR